MPSARARLRGLALGLSLALAPVVTPTPASAEGPRRPNVVIILADDLGYGDLSCYGAKDLKSPHIDALAHAGMRLDRFYANSTVCSPTRAALLSGRYPDLVGVPGVIRTHPEDSWGYLDPKATLLPRVLKAAGYHTAAVGKWHLGLAHPNLPNERGFDTFRGFLGDMMDDYSTHRRHGINYMRRDAEEVDPRGHATVVFTRWAVEYLDSRKGDPSPFFLYLAYNAPHAPVQPPPESLARVRGREPNLPEKRARIVALIEHLDDAVGQVVGALKANGQWENTLLVFTSDNGGQLSEGANCGELRGGKGDLYEGGIRVPFCAVWPGQIPAGSHSERIALTMDLLPTVVEAAGITKMPRIDGVSLLGTLRHSGDRPAHRELFWMRREGGPRYQGQDYHAVRRGEWKLIQNDPFRQAELFNLHEDPLEQHDVAKAHRGIVDELSRSLRDHLQRAGAVPWQPPSRLDSAD